MRWFPVVGWAERGDGRAGGHGNSVPRFHVTWGTGPGVVEPFLRKAIEAERAGLLRFAFRHQVDELVVEGGAVTGVRGTVLAPATQARGHATNRDRVGEFELTAQAVVVTSGGIGGNHDLVRAAWPARLGTPPEHMVAGVPAPRRRPDARHHPERRREHHQRRPDVALRRGPAQLGADLARPRHPHPAGSVVDVVRRRRAPAARPAVPRVRHARHPGAPAPQRVRPLVVRPHAEHPREGVRPLRVRAEPRPDRQVGPPGARTRSPRRRPSRCRTSSTTATTSSRPRPSTVSSSG